MKAELRCVSQGRTYWFDVESKLGVKYDAHCVWSTGKWYASVAVTGKPVVIHSGTYREIVAACLPLIDEPHEFSI